jgi:hypothetical protein
MRDHLEESLGIKWRPPRTPPMLGERPGALLAGRRKCIVLLCIPLQNNSLA